jgi:hypothetical protein
MLQTGAKEDRTMAKRRRHTPDQIICKLAEGSKLLAGGAELDEVRRHLQIAESTWHRWLDPVRVHEGERRQAPEGA